MPFTGERISGGVATVGPVVGAEWAVCEAELNGKRAALPLPHRLAWATSFEGRDSFFLAARDGAGACRGGVAVAVARSRALPKHLIWRVSRCVPRADDGALEAVFTALADLARRNPRVLRVNVELFSPEPSSRLVAGHWLAALGFHPAREQRNYRNTLSVDLTPPEDAIFSRLHRRARRAIRAIEKNKLELRLIANPALGDRMEELRTATSRRLGRAFAPRDWGAVMNFSHQHPGRSRLVGVFRPDTIGPGTLLAYAWGLHHTDHAEYYAGASAREEMNRPVGYGPMWDLICWAKRHEATWFDMGGVTSGSFADKDDALGGISDFKRTFSTTQVQVCEEWELEPHPVRAKLARLIGAVARRFGGPGRS